MTLKRLIATASILVIAATVADAKPPVVMQAPIDDRFDLVDFVTWGGGANGVGYVAAIALIAREGEVVLCGAGHFGRDSQLRSATRRVLRGTQFLANGEIVLTDMTYFNKVDRNQLVDGTLTNCASTGVSVTEPDVEWGFGPEGGGRYRID